MDRIVNWQGPIYSLQNKNDGLVTAPSDDLAVLTYYCCQSLTAAIVKAMPLDADFYQGPLASTYHS